jgi:hypothetical protein
MRALVTGTLRRAGALFLRALIAVPIRQIDLPRFTRRRKFRDLHRESVAWLDSHFELIEQGAPWLHQVGSDVWDYCSAQVRNPVLQFTPGFSAQGGCSREVTAVYGFNGDLTTCLHSLDQAISPAGWEMGELARGQAWADLNGTEPVDTLARHRTSWMRERRVGLRWLPSAALPSPSFGSATQLPDQSHTPCMRVTWSSRGQETGWQRDPNKTRAATRNYLPLEVSASETMDLLDKALTRYEHALTVTIRLGYYANRNARLRPHRMPRYLFPTRN